MLRVALIALLLLSSGCSLNTRIKTPLDATAAIQVIVNSNMSPEGKQAAIGQILARLDKEGANWKEILLTLITAGTSIGGFYLSASK